MQDQVTRLERRTESVDVDHLESERGQRGLEGLDEARTGIASARDALNVAALNSHGLLLENWDRHRVDRL